MVGFLITAIVLVILRGDRVGLTIQRSTPNDLASAQSIIQVTFDQNLDPASVENRIRFDPPVEGEISVNNNQLQFRPNQPLQIGQTYTVQVEAGIQSSSGRALLSTQAWQFRVRSPQVIYLGPVDNPIQNLFMVDPDSPDLPARQLTLSERGVLSYDVMPDGSRIAYAELGEQRNASLFVYDLRTNQNTLLLDCPTAACTTPAWRPDGTLVAYERSELNLGTGAGPGSPRIWLLDTTNGTTRQLFNDNQRLGYSPRWSPDGKILASYDANALAIVLYNFETGTEQAIRTPQGEVGHFSPDGRWLFFPKILEQADGRFVAHYTLADLTSPNLVQRDLIPDDDPNNDVELAWMPDSKSLIVTRRPPTITTRQGAQLHLVNIETNESIPLVTDDEYSNGQVSVRPDGEVILFQRFALGRAGARPEVWIYHMQSGTKTLVAANATLPRWLP